MFEKLVHGVASGRKWLSNLAAPPRLAPEAFKDDVLTEAEMLDEEFVVLTGAPLDADYKRQAKEIDDRYQRALGDLAVPPGPRVPVHLIEAITRLQRERAAARRRAFGEFVHRSGTRRSALCLSGGGIRSATFSLGVVQALAEHGLLNNFHYLSTVSGGGYTGGWLSAWIHRHERGLTGVQEDLQRGEPATLFRLREYSRYLAPRFGFVTSDTWTLVGTYIRNLLITWFALLPILAAALALPRLLVAIINAQPDPRMDRMLAWANLQNSTEEGLLATAYVAVILLWWALMAMAVSLPGVARPRNVLIHTESQFVTRCLVPLGVAGVLLTVSWRLFNVHPDLPKALLSYWAPWFTDLRWPDWLVMGGTLHLFALMPALGLRLVGDTYTILSANSAARDPSSSIGETAAAIYRESSATINFVWGELSAALGRSVAAIVFCGGLGGMLMWAVASLVAPMLGTSGLAPIDIPLFVTLAPVGLWTGVLMAGTIYVAAVSQWSTDHEREWYARAGAWIIILMSIWVTLCSITFFGPSLIGFLGQRGTVILSGVGAVAGVVAVLRGRTSKGATAKRPDESAGALGIAIDRLTTLAGPVFLVFALSVISAATTVVLAELRQGDLFIDGTYRFAFTIGTFNHLQELTSAKVIDVLLFIVALTAIAAAIDRIVDLGVFSLHAMYRDRLIRAYLGSSRRVRHSNAFTGLDSDDNVALVQLRPGFFAHSDAPQLAQVMRAHFRRPTRSIAEPEPQTPASDTVKGLVMDLLAEKHLDVLMAVANGKAGHPLSADQEEILIQRWNAVLLQPAFCEHTGAGGAGDPVLANRKYLCAQSWFKAAAACPPATRLFPVINTALNLMTGSHLANDRKAEPFSLTPLHAGAPVLGFTRLFWHSQQKWPTGPEVRYYAGTNGVSLGTAMTISGAAANPNMGYHSSPVMTFLLALFNARLGMWIASPSDRRIAGDRKPRHAVPLVFREAFGVRGTDRGFINLSDGGHFENLGLYEMVRRRCHIILVVDAGQDPKCEFGDLGNAISKIRVDFGIPITFIEPMPVRCRTNSKGEQQPSAHGALARIEYKEVDQGEGVENGWLLYVKPALDGREPADVLAYAQRDRQFPHQPTANQFFSESQFESYRMLGAYSIEKILGDSAVTLVNDLYKPFQEHHKRPL